MKPRELLRVSQEKPMNLLQRYRDMSAPVKASAWYAVCDVIQKGILVLTIPIFTRIMTTAEYGLTNVYNSWLAIIVIFATLNLQHGTFNMAMVEFEDDRDKYISAVQGLVTTSVMVLFLIYLPLSTLFDDITKLNLPLFAAMAIQMITTASFGFWSGKKRFDYLYKKVVALTVISAVLTTAISILMVVTATDNRGEIKIISTVLTQALLFIPVYFANAIKGKSFFVKKYWLFALGMNLPLIPYYLAQAVFNNADLLMIQAMCGMSDAALYGTVYSFATMMTLIINAINNSFVPWKYKKIKRDDFENMGTVTNGIAVLVAGLLVLIILLGPEIVQLLAAPAYYEARWVFPPVAASMYFLFFVQQYIDVEFLLKNRLMLVAGSIAAAVANIVLNALFIPQFGYMAAAYTTLASYIIFVICNYFAVRRGIRTAKAKYQVRDFCNTRFLAVVGIGIIAVTLLSSLLYTSDAIRYMSICVALIIAILLRGKIKAILGSFRK